MKHILKASQYINYNRISTGGYTGFNKLLLILSGIVEVFRSTCYIKPSSVVECNLCGWTGRSFVNFYTGYGHVYRNSVCPRCFSHPRHRSYSYCLKAILEGRKERLRLLHFSPEVQIERTIKSYSSVDYLSVDIDHTKAMRKEDIRSLSFSDNSFDAIVCIHVFEHIDDDDAAMREVYRVLKYGGVALLDVPIDYSRDSTFEDPSIITPEARTEAYWQWDHVRLYARDYPDKLRSIGFNVQVINHIAEIGEHNIRRFGLENEPNYVCTK